jgi:hypothetical protein
MKRVSYTTIYGEHKCIMVPDSDEEYVNEYENRLFKKRNERATVIMLQKAPKISKFIGKL